jgi:hypothetical protein
MRYNFVGSTSLRFRLLLPLDVTASIVIPLLLFGILHADETRQVDRRVSGDLPEVE